MEEPKPSTNSNRIREPELRFPAGDSPKPHPPRPTDPRAVEAHFAPLSDSIERPTAQRRLASKVNVPFKL
jgi:hypothetical protein